MMWVSTLHTKRRTYRLCAGKLPKLESESEEEEYSRETPDFPDDIPKSGGSGGGGGTEQPKPSSPGFSKVEAEPLWGLDPKHDGSSFDNDIDSRFHPSRFDGPSGLDKQMEGTATGPKGKKVDPLSRTQVGLYVMPLDAAPVKRDGVWVTDLAAKTYALYDQAGRRIGTIDNVHTVPGSWLNQALGSYDYDPDAEYQVTIDPHDDPISWAPFYPNYKLSNDAPRYSSVMMSFGKRIDNNKVVWQPYGYTKPRVQQFGAHGTANLLQSMGYNSSSPTSYSSNSTSSWTLRHSDGSIHTQNGHTTQDPSPGQLQVFPPSLSPIASALGSGWSKSTTTTHKK